VGSTYREDKSSIGPDEVNQTAIPETEIPGKMIRSAEKQKIWHHSPKEIK
jgi:hypothetical protein